MQQHSIALEKKFSPYSITIPPNHQFINFRTIHIPRNRPDILSSFISHYNTSLNFPSSKHKREESTTHQPTMALFDSDREELEVSHIMSNAEADPEYQGPSTQPRTLAGHRAIEGE